jgi:hypothetical protein
MLISGCVVGFLNVILGPLPPRRRKLRADLLLEMDIRSIKVMDGLFDGLPR